MTFGKTVCRPISPGEETMQADNWVVKWPQFTEVEIKYYMASQKASSKGNARGFLLWHTQL
jgi:hypothetical protein